MNAISSERKCIRLKHSDDKPEEILVTQTSCSPFLCQFLHEEQEVNMSAPLTYLFSWRKEIVSVSRKQT